MEFDLTSEAGRKRLANIIASDVEEATEVHFREGFRRHLGASIIGHDCARYLFNNFRWIVAEKVGGRMRRLWNRGHKEEPRMIEWLRLVGFEVREFDHDADGLTQYRIEGSQGHFGGSLDTIAFCPPRYNLVGNPLLTEYKTHNDKSFKEMKKLGLLKSKPYHFRQMSSYGKAYGIRYGLYCAVNKNDDTLYYEVVELDWSQADDLYRKADEIIFATMLPRKISDDPTFYKCKMCPHIGVCHLGEPAERNCRSCEHSRPIEGKAWWCDLHSPQANEAIPSDVIPKGCPSWKSII